MPDLPQVTARACRECPWTRNSAPGWLGPYEAEDWLLLAGSDEAIACHETVREDESWESARQCLGAAQFRRNISKMPRDPRVAVADDVDTEQVFANSHEFLNHHLPILQESE